MDAENKVDILDLDGNNGCEHCACSGKYAFLFLLGKTMFRRKGKWTLRCKSCGNTLRPPKKVLQTIAVIDVYYFWLMYFAGSLAGRFFFRSGASIWTICLWILGVSNVCWLIISLVFAIILAKSQWENALLRVWEDIEKDYRDAFSKHSKMVNKILFIILIILLFLSIVLF